MVFGLGAAEVEYQYEAGGEVKRVRVEPQADGFAVTLDGQTYFARVTPRRPGELLVDLAESGQQLAVIVVTGAQRWVALPGATSAGPFVLTVPAEGLRRRGAAGGHDALVAQMPGVVQQVLVTPGEAVERGQTLVLLEAMKLEIKVAAPHSGTVRAVAVAAGQSVERGQPLVDLAA
ncbi:MAG: biotin/lipoyl-binding protein [Anaerolineales bacterium]|nr:biotin/lipoyl-binding protein [Anaerolineales bacterium]